MKYFLIVRVLFFAAIGLFQAQSDAAADGAGPFLAVDYRQVVPAESISAYDVVILSSDLAGEMPEKVDPEQLRLGYLSLLEIAPDASYREEAFSEGVVSAGKNEVWNSDLIDPSSEVWQGFVLETLAPRILERGFDGFFLDTAESVELLAGIDPEKGSGYRKGLVNLVESLRIAFPDAEIVINRGFTVLPKLYTIVDGVLAESLFRSYNYGDGIYEKVSKADSEWMLDHLRPAREAGLEVYIVDFLPRTEPKLANQVAEKIREEGFVPLLTEPDLMGEIVAPLPLIPRQIMGLYGRILGEGEFEWAEDTDTMTYFQLPLEYLGYELEFRNFQTEGLPDSLAVDLGGIMIDETLEVPPADQEGFVDWLIEVKRSGRKIFFVGTLPSLGEEATRKLALEFGLGGTLGGISGATEVALESVNPSVMGFEVEPMAQPTGIIDLQAPPGSEVFLDVRVETRSGEVFQGQPVFAAPWGGAALFPFLAILNPEQIPMLQVDPFALMERFLDRVPFPVPDTTTLQGRRSYFSHIDGDGFLNFSEIAPGTRSGLVVRDQIIEKYGLPVTVSFIESEIRGDSTVYTEKAGESFPEDARSLFANAYVEPSSHTYSHPFFWSYADPTSQSYETQNVNIKTEYNYDTIEFPKEIVDSIDYMNEELGVPGKRANLLLWSGNCRPPPEALKVAADAGILNMNGGNTVITDRAPYLSLVSPKAVRWGGQTQVYAPVQNENNFNNTFGNDRYGGFANVRQTFDLTGSPRRLKPLNVYYHFYSADRFDSFTALRRAIEYCEGQEMHPLWGGEFVRMVLDSLGTQVYFMGPRAWRVVNGGESQTLRLPAELGYPDLNHSSGIIGFSDFKGQRYFHTDGGQRVDLVLADLPPSTPYLMDSRATVRNFQVEGRLVTFETFNRARDPMRLRLGGMGNRVKWTVLSGDEKRIETSSLEGVLELEASSGTISWRLASDQR